MPTILDTIVEGKRAEVERHKAKISLAELQRHIAKLPAPLNFSGALWGDSIQLIAEVKKASPSRGLLRADFDPVELAMAYERNGAAAISVLTDPHFQGDLVHLQAVSEAVRPMGTPVLRKDFITDPYQVYEARAHGADAILLIVAIVSYKELRDLLDLAGSLWLQCVVEVHDKEELEEAQEAGAEVIGINNRDLHTFHTDLGVTKRLARLVSRGTILISESGICTRDDMLRLRRFGVSAALVGEAIVTCPDVGAKVRELLTDGTLVTEVPR